MKQHLTDLFTRALHIAVPEATEANIVLERPKQVQHGDYACNLAMQLARSLKRNPREIASALLDALPASPWVEKAEIAGAGFHQYLPQCSIQAACCWHDPATGCLNLAAARREKAKKPRLNSFPPIRPVRSMSAMAAEPPSA